MCSTLKLEGRAKSLDDSKNAQINNNNVTVAYDSYEVELDPLLGKDPVIVEVKHGTSVLDALDEDQRTALGMNAEGKLVDEGKMFQGWFSPGTDMLGNPTQDVFDVTAPVTDVASISATWDKVIALASGEAVVADGGDLGTAFTYADKLYDAVDCFNTPDGLEVVSMSDGSFTSTEAAHDAGTYKSIFRPKDGYCWSDGSTEPRTLSWTIAPATLTATYLGSTVQAGMPASLKVQVSGFKGNDNPGNIAGYEAPRVTLPDLFTPWEPMALLPTGGYAGPNYVFKYVSGDLTVMPEEQKPESGDKPSSGTNENPGTNASVNGNGTGASNGGNTNGASSGGGDDYPVMLPLNGGVAGSAASQDRAAASDGQQAAQAQGGAATQRAIDDDETPLASQGSEEESLPWFAYLVLPVLVLAGAAGISMAVVRRKRNYHY